MSRRTAVRDTARTAAARLARGSAALDVSISRWLHLRGRAGLRRAGGATRAVRTWVSAGEGLLDLLLRVAFLLLLLGGSVYFAPSFGIGFIGLLVSVVFAVWWAPTVGIGLTVCLAAEGTPALMYVVVAVWAVLAWRAAPPDEDGAEGDETEEAPREGAAAPLNDPLLALTARLLGPSRGVHARDIAAALNEAAPHRQRTAAEVRSALAARGVRTRDSVRAPAGAVPGARETITSGLYREDLEAVTGPLPAPALKSASEEAATAVAAPLTCDVADAATGVAPSVAETATSSAETSI